MALMDETQILAKGFWCEYCEMFEPDEFDEERRMCMACGCPRNKHIPVAIVDLSRD